MEFTPDQIKILYLKRWSGLTVKILLTEWSIINSTSETAQQNLRKHLRELEEIKTEEKKQFQII